MVSLVQCGWCPVILYADDCPGWYLHFTEVHHVSGYPVRYIQGDDWDVAGLASTPE